MYMDTNDVKYNKLHLEFHMQLSDFRKYQTDGLCITNDLLHYGSIYHNGSALPSGCLQFTNHISKDLKFQSRASLTLFFRSTGSETGSNIIILSSHQESCWVKCLRQMRLLSLLVLSQS